MKIGILTFHRAHNYGAVLQCYALKETLRKMGHDVYVIDYRQPDIEHVYSFPRSLRLDKFIATPFALKLSYIVKHILLDIVRIPNYFHRKGVFQRFRNKYLNLTCKVSSIPNNFDAYVIGSDMLWADDCMCGHFEKNYMGDFTHKEDSKVVAYAVSGTPKSFQKCADIYNYSFLDNFDAISVREESLAEIVRANCKRNIHVCIDPTLLTGKDTWRPLVNNKWSNRKYILTYYLRVQGEQRINIDKKVYSLAKTLGYEIIDLDINPVSRYLEVEDFVSVIASAQLIVTDSFHGIIFSMIFNRPFNAICLNDSHDARYTDIIKKLGIKETLRSTEDTFFIPNIDYNIVNKNIHDFQLSSINYIEDNL